MRSASQVQPHQQAIGEEDPHRAEGEIDQRDRAWHERTQAQLVRRRRASAYFSLVRAMMSGGSFGPGGRLSQSSVSR